MDQEHLDPSVFNRLLAGVFSEDGSTEGQLFHLLVCEDCRRSFLTAHPEEGPLFLEQMLGDSQSWIHPQSNLTRDPVLQREILASTRLMEELLGSKHARCLLMVRNLPRFQLLPVAVACLNESKRLFRVDPQESLEWADVALAVLSSLPEGRYAEALVADFQARGWAYRANALRNRSSLDEASEAFETAWRCFWQGSIVAAEWARIASLEASLRRDQLRFQEARSLLLDAIGIFRELGERREEARLLVAKAHLAGEEGAVEEAARILQEVLGEFTRPELGDFLAYAALQSLSVSLVDLGRATEARELFPQVQSLAEQGGERLILLDVDWLEGMICHAEGHHALAETRYQEVRQAFLELDMPYDAVTVSLELAVLYLETGRTSEVKALATEVLPIFRSRRIHRQAAVTGLVLIEALRQEAATVERVQELVTYMRRSRGTNPTG